MFKLQIWKHFQHSSIKVGVWNIQIKSSPEAKIDFPLLRFLPALHNRSYQLAGLEWCQLNSWGSDRGLGVWVGLGMHCIGVGDKFCLLKRRMIFLSGSDKIVHDDFVKLVFWPEIWSWDLAPHFFCTLFIEEEKEGKYFLWEHYKKSVIWNKRKV